MEEHGTMCSFDNDTLPVYDVNNVFYHYKLRYPILQQRFNIHDHNHRSSCYKKAGLECRFNLPKYINDTNCISYDKQNSFSWYNVTDPLITMEPHQFLHKQNIGDQFMNENNSIITSVLACNNNVNCADRRIIYYTTYYGTKQNQQEESLPYLSICQSLHERIMKQHLAQQENPDPDYDPDAPDSVEGFRHLKQLN